MSFQIFGTDHLRHIPTRPPHKHSKHPEAELVPGVWVDEQMVPLIAALWELDYETEFCCQGDPQKVPLCAADVVRNYQSKAYITFATLGQGVRFLALMHDRMGYTDYYRYASLITLEASLDTGKGPRACVRFDHRLLKTITDIMEQETQCKA